MVQTQAQAMQMGFLFLLPNILLSGFMFPREAMPEAAQWLGATLPLTYFLQVLRGVLLKAAGPEAIWRQALVLTGFAFGVAAIAVGRFRKNLE
jgi:ABC-2 type transport system permease protein